MATGTERIGQEGRRDPLGGLSASEFHNAAVDAMRLRGRAEALRVVRRGLEDYPNDADLLADALSYAGGIDDTGSYERLRGLDRSRYTWRAYDFLIDYMVDVLVPKAEGGRATELLEEALGLADDFVREFPYDERAYLAKAKVLECRNGEQDKKDVEELYGKVVDEAYGGQAGGKTRLPIPAMSLRYADLLLQRGRYEDVVRVARIGLATSAQEQPPVRVGYLCYLKALAEDALVHLDSLGEGGDAVYEDEARIGRILREYRIAYDLLEGSDTYLSNIRNRTRILEGLSGFELQAETRREGKTEGGPSALGLLESLARDGR